MLLISLVIRYHCFETLTFFSSGEANMNRNVQDVCGSECIVATTVHETRTSLLYNNGLYPGDV